MRPNDSDRDDEIRGQLAIAVRVDVLQALTKGIARPAAFGATRRAGHPAL